MKKRLLICLIAVLTVNLYAADAVLEEFTSKLNRRNEWLPVEYLEVIKSKNRDTMKAVAPNLSYEKEWDELHDCWSEWYDRYVQLVVADNLDDILNLDENWKGRIDIPGKN